MPQLGFKAKLSITDGTEGAYSPVGKTVTIKLPEFDVTDHEHAEHDQEDYEYRLVPGLVKSSRLTVEAYYTPELYARIYALRRVRHDFQVEQPEDAAGEDDPQVFTFEGYVSKGGGSTFERDGLTMFAFEVSVSGPWTITGGPA